MTCPELEVQLDPSTAQPAVAVHLQGCARCQARQAVWSTAMREARAVPPGGAEFRRQVLQRLDERVPAGARPWAWLPLAALASALLVLISPSPRRDPFSARGGVPTATAFAEVLVQDGDHASPVHCGPRAASAAGADRSEPDRDTSMTVEASASGARMRRDAAYIVRVGNPSDARLWLGAFLLDSAGDVHWLAPHYANAAAPPTLAPVSPLTPAGLLETGVAPEAPAAGAAELVTLLVPEASDVRRVEALIAGGGVAALAALAPVAVLRCPIEVLGAE